MELQLPEGYPCRFVCARIFLVQYVDASRIPYNRV